MAGKLFLGLFFFSSLLWLRSEPQELAVTAALQHQAAIQGMRGLIAVQQQECLNILFTCSLIIQMQALIYVFFPLFCHVSGSQSPSIDKAIRTAIVLIGIMGRDLGAVQLLVLWRKAPRTRLMLMWEGVLLSVLPCPALPAPLQ